METGNIINLIVIVMTNENSGKKKKKKKKKRSYPNPINNKKYITSLSLSSVNIDRFF